MRRAITYLSVIAVTILMAIGVTVAPAAANAPDPGPIPSGVGLSGSWTFTSATNMTVRMAIPGAGLVAYGMLANGGFTYTVTVTDTLLFDGQCAFFFYNDDFDGSAETCGTGTYTVPPDTTNVDFELCVTSASPAYNPTGRHGCIVLYAPPLNQPWIYAAGNSFSWSYYDTPNPYDWQAHLDLDWAELDYFGVDNYGGPHRILVSSYLTLTTGSNICGYADVEDYPTPLTSASLCGTNQITELPDYVDSGPYPPGANLCVWRNRVRPIVKNCVYGSVWDPYGVALY